MQGRANRLLDNIYTAVLVFDRKLQLTDINTAGENLLSISHRKMCGHYADEILTTPHKLVENIRRALKTRQPYMEWGIALSLPNGKAMTVDYMLTPLMDGEGCNEVILELINANSYTRVMRENHLSLLHDTARKSLQGMAHEIKNPLGGLRGAAQLLEGELNGSELVEYTRIIINEADRLHKLIDRMLTPAVKRTVSRINIHELMEYACNVVQAEARLNTRIQRDYDPSLPMLKGDREQLIQALLNILRNATQAIDENGEILLRTRVKHRMTIRQQPYKLAVQIDVIDTGPGVPADIEEQLFYPLVTGRAEGTGLGLSISQSLIQSHNGIIQYERIADQTCFQICLPLAEGSGA